MYKPDPASGYWRTVTYYYYTEAGELDEGHQLRVKFRAGISRSERTALFSQADDGTQKYTDEEIWARLVLAAADGEIDVPTAEAMDIPNVIEVVYRDYINSCRELREKLIEAARYWLGGCGGGEVDKQDLEVFGITAADLPPNDEPQHFFVRPENWDAVRVFVSVQTQWKTHPLGGLSGLNYEAVAYVMGWLGVEDQAEAFDGLQIMELVMISEARKKPK